MTDFLENYQSELIITAIVFLTLIVIRYITHFTVKKIGFKNGLNSARIATIQRYISIILFLIAIVWSSLIFGTDFHDIALIFSSVFAVIGIGLFAIWSILSNITSGIIMFFSFPYKVGDKIEIHDPDFPITAIIEDIRTFQVHLRTEKGDLVTYPNNLMLQKAVTLIKKDAIRDINQSW